MGAGVSSAVVSLLLWSPLPPLVSSLPCLIRPPTLAASRPPLQLPPLPTCHTTRGCYSSPLPFLSSVAVHTSLPLNPFAYALLPPTEMPAILRLTNDSLFVSGGGERRRRESPRGASDGRRPGGAAAGREGGGSFCCSERPPSCRPVPCEHGGCGGGDRDARGGHAAPHDGLPAHLRAPAPGKRSARHHGHAFSQQNPDQAGQGGRHEAHH
mmetsp:Transcript_18040/g.50476  ORF Transcript_18040/g.50476 Transcript_18040/m.50476 type:complete len:211 (-) Transcript_18040:3551-4183(-)